MWETRPGKGRQNAFPYGLIPWLSRQRDCFLLPLLRISHQKMRSCSSILPSCTSSPPQLLLRPAGWEHCSLWGESISRALNSHITLAGSGGAEKFWGKAPCFVQTLSSLFITRGAERCVEHGELGAISRKHYLQLKLSLCEKEISHLCSLWLCLSCQKISLAISWGCSSASSVLVPSRMLKDPSCPGESVHPLSGPELWVWAQRPSAVVMKVAKLM